MNTIEKALELACETLSERIDCPLEARTIEEEVEIETICKCNTECTSDLDTSICWRKVLMHRAGEAVSVPESINRGLERL